MCIAQVICFRMKGKNFLSLVQGPTYTCIYTAATTEAVRHVCRFRRYAQRSLAADSIIAGGTQHLHMAIAIGEEKGHLADFDARYSCCCCASHGLFS